jgi:hypothetical protein
MWIFWNGFSRIGFVILDLDIWFFGFGHCRLLIQRCTRVRGKGNFFDKGVVSPDEGRKCPTNELNPAGCGPGIWSKDVQTGLQVFLVAFPDRDLISQNIDGISADIVDFTEIDDIGAMDFEESLAVEFFFHIL